jgi:putative zinc finger/helix-turn-helix YgiT family protein
MSAETRTCALCGAKNTRSGDVSLVREVGKHTFTTTVTGTICDACGESLTDLRDGERFDLAIAELLAEAAPTGDAFRFLRKVAGLRARDVAEMLGITNDTVSRWENGKHAVDRAAFFILGQIVREKRDGLTTMLDLLSRGQLPKALPERVEVHLD